MPTRATQPAETRVAVLADGDNTSPQVLGYALRRGLRGVLQTISLNHD